MHKFITSLFVIPYQLGMGSSKFGGWSPSKLSYRPTS